MKKLLCFAFSMLVSTAFAFPAQDVASAVEGMVKTIDSHSQTIIVKTDNGVEQTFRFTDRTAVLGARETAKGSLETLNGLKEGSEVAVHYTDRGTVKAAEEIDQIGKDGLKAGEGTIKNIDRDAKTLTMETAGGAEETYQLSERAAQEAGMEFGKADKKLEKVTVYYTEEAGQKIARFFKRVV